MTKKDLKRVLEIESVLTELMLWDYNHDANEKGWSSRVQAERIYAIALGKSTEKIKKPWEYFGIKPKPAPPKGNCAVCGNFTEWACSERAGSGRRIDTKKTVWVCNKTSCRDEHEKICSRASL